MAESAHPPGFSPLQSLDDEPGATTGVLLPEVGLGDRAPSLAVAHEIPRGHLRHVRARVEPLVGNVVPGCIPLVRIGERDGRGWLFVRYLDGVPLDRLVGLSTPAVAHIGRTIASALARLRVVAPDLVVVEPSADHVLVDGAGGVYLLAPCLACPKPGSPAGSPTLDEDTVVRAVAGIGLAVLGKDAPDRACAEALLEVCRTPRGLLSLAAVLRPLTDGGTAMLAASARALLPRGAAPGVGTAERSTIADRPGRPRGARATSRAAHEGDVLDGRYRLGRLLGEGGMGRVYEAQHVRLDKAFAVKVLLPADRDDPAALARMQREARLASKVGHPGIVQVFDFGRTDHGEPYIVMELFHGRDLGNVLRRERRLAPERAIRLFLQVCDAMAAAHDAGVIHRDLKPSNILVAEAPEGERTKVADFGLAIAGATQENVLTDGEHLIGTPAYMAPELAAGPAENHAVDGRLVDVYGLGVMLYELLSGALPFETHGRTTLRDLAKTRQAPPPPLASRGIDVPREIEELVRAAVSADPTLRPRSVRELGARLAAAAGLSLSETTWRSLLAEQAGTPVFGIPTDPLIGTDLGPYRALRSLPGSGHAYLGEHVRLGRAVVLKRLPDTVASSPEALLRWLEECRVAATLRHALVARLEEALPGGRWRTVMAVEHVPGYPLSDLLAEQGRGDHLGVKQAVSLARDAALAIGAFHDAGIAHGAVRADHFVHDVAGGRLVLVDHGVLERTTGKASVAADVAALGGLLRDLVARATPRSGTAGRTLLRRAGAIATACEARNPEGLRPPASAAQVAQALDDALAEAANQAPPENLTTAPLPTLSSSADAETPPAPPPRRRRLWLLDLMLAVLALAASLAAALTIPPPRPPPPLPVPGTWLPAYVRLAVDSEPEDVRVYLLGRALPLGYTPLRVAVAGSLAPATLLFVRDGRVVATRQIVPNRDLRVDVKLH